MRGRAALAAALAVVAAGCGGSGGDKAGGQEDPVPKPLAPVGEPVTLRLVTVDVLWAEEFAAAAARLSGGTIRIEIRPGGSAIVDYERRLVDKVRAGEADLVSVGARAWDRMGVSSFRALVAPFLVDSLELERRVLEGRSAEQMLAGVEPLGLVGLAVLPGGLRRPLGLSRPLVALSDYAGAVVGIRYGRVAQDTIAALGATPRAYRIGSLSGLDGAELDAWTVSRNDYGATGAALTGNVVLWPRPETIVMSSDAFDRLVPAQQEVLRRAGREAVAPALARVSREQDEALEVACGRGTLSLPTASAAELDALRAAVEPVYAALESDPLTRKLIAEIRQLRTGDAANANSIRCPKSQAGASELEGVWESRVTREAMLAGGASVAEAATYAGAAALALADGRWTFDGDHTTVTGTYVVKGDALRLTMLTCTTNPCSPGLTTDYTWSVYRDVLTLTRRPGRAAFPRLVAKPSRRVG
jgi:TRAP-type C4-dicarboxylate transport system substrate-binding protein